VLCSLLRDLALLAANSESSSLANADLRADLNRLTSAFDADRTTRAFGAVDRAIWALDRPRYVGYKIVASWLTLQI
jgi:hypothetical protein